MTKEQEYLWVPDLPDHWWSILISANGASSARSCKDIKMLGLIGLKGTGKE